MNINLSNKIDLQFLRLFLFISCSLFSNFANSAICDSSILIPPQYVVDITTFHYWAFDMDSLKFYAKGDLSIHKDEAIQRKSTWISLDIKTREVENGIEISRSKLLFGSEQFSKILSHFDESSFQLVGSSVEAIYARWDMNSDNTI